ncbi:hypothetical protein D1007_34999 [Hordeum vulgare]|nr:hypothetical protein D1007_34999 [Hordeum vulgare]
MVFDDESSDDTSSPYMHSTGSTDGLQQVPFSLEDPDYKGLELDMMVFCEKHDKASQRLVGFEGTYTGRRSEPVADMKGQMTKKYADHQHLNEKYQLLVNPT